MPPETIYTVVETTWGYLALVGTPRALQRVILPQPDRAELLARLGKEPNARFCSDYFRSVQRKIQLYFAGSAVQFGLEIPVELDQLSPFCRQVLSLCRQIRFGKTTSYGRLAYQLGRPGAARAVGRALGRNPLPLIIPCHRVLRSDGALGGFSAPGGTTLKARLLEHERAVLAACASGSVGRGSLPPRDPAIDY